MVKLLLLDLTFFENFTRVAISGCNLMTHSTHNQIIYVKRFIQYNFKSRFTLRDRC